MRDSIVDRKAVEDQTVTYCDTRRHARTDRRFQHPATRRSVNRRL